jgi:hypothetical protein
MGKRGFAAIMETASQIPAQDHTTSAPHTHTHTLSTPEADNTPRIMPPSDPSEQNICEGCQ